MRFHLFKKQLALYGIGLAFVLGCEKNMPDAPKAVATPEKPSEVSFDDVKRDAARSITTTATYSQQERDSMIEDMKAKMATRISIAILSAGVRSESPDRRVHQH